VEKQENQGKFGWNNKYRELSYHDARRDLPPDAKLREEALSTAHNLGQGYSDSLLVLARQP
jgi:hypothetical protein